MEIQGKSYIICGATRTGKSTLLFKLLKLIKKIDLIFVYTSTGYEWLHVKKAIVLGFDQLEKVDLLFHEKLKPLNKVIVIDNFIGEKKIKLPVIDKIYTSGRHYGITCFILTQYISGHITPVVRDNTNYYFIMRTKIRTYEILFEQQNYYTKKKDFIDYCLKNQKKYNPILIDNYNLELENNIILLK